MAKLTNSERDLIHCSIEKFMKKSNPMESMAIFYDFLFRDYPHYQKYFHRWEDVEEKELKNFIYCDFLVNNLGKKVLGTVESLVLVMENKEDLLEWVDALLAIPQHQRLALNENDYLASFVSSLLCWFR